MANKIGHVTQRRFDALVDQTQDMMRVMTGYQFAIGDMALEIEPMRPTPGGNEGIYATLRIFADEIGEAFNTVIDWRRVAHAWPADRRSADASYAVHQVMASHPDRFKLIREPPRDRRGRRRWTTGAAIEAVGRRMSADIQVQRIRDLASEDTVVADTVASTAAAEFLSRRDVAGRVMADPNTRRQLHRAQHDHDQQVQDTARERTPAIKQVEHSIHYLDLLRAGHAFATGIKRLMPRVQANPLSRQEREAIHHLLDQAQAAIDFCRSVIDTGDLTMDEQLAKLLDEEEGP